MLFRRSLIIVPTDRDDEEFVRVAVASQSPYIISRDRHLLDLGRYEAIQVVRPSVFMAGWRAASRQTDRQSSPSIWNRIRWRVWGKKTALAL